ncbi:helix-turn-helix domain-containing protein [Aerococcus sp. UMB7834]|uniref:helix-turn-helix domain-containing protein n=1 Tax=Aerococcus sp. UMB7834 TaxID=3046342 RepID=UPI002550DB00|nr:helix-turn-helix domain-containing protein [Aerococcus sp. UMB7834]MDK6804491.1 helix-turn-helix domain-containing protein [Aerococcus sp. UMB7834]
MQISQLMERSQAATYQVVHQLIQQAGPLPIKTLKDQVDLSQATLDKYLRAIQEAGQAGEMAWRLDWQDDQVNLWLDQHLSQEEILAYFLQDSIKYQVLDYLFEKGEFAINQLADQLLVSEATLNRNLAQLNQDLQEFGLQIRNGRLKGPHHQVLYFYYQLYTSSLPPATKDGLIKQYGLKAYLPYFEKINKGPFTPRGEDRLALWLYVTQRLASFNDRDYESLYRISADLQDRPFYQRARQHLLRYQSQLARDFQEGDLVSHVLFLSSHYLLSPSVNEQFLGYGGPIMSATSQTVRLLNQDQALDKREKARIVYEAGQSYSALSYFQGFLLQGPLPDANSSYAQAARDLLAQVVPKTLPISLDDRGDLLTWVQWKWGQTLETLDLREEAVYQVAVRLDPLTNLDRKTMLELRQQLEIHRRLSLDPYQEGMAYDFLISDYRQASDYPAQTYYLKENLSPYDLKYLKQVLQQKVGT